MDFAPTPEQEALRALARQILGDHTAPRRLEEVEATADRVDHDLWAALAGAGLLGTCVPEEHGGSGLGFTDLCVLLEEVGAAVAPVPAYPALTLGALPVAELGTPDQRRRYLPSIAAGDAVLTAALQEPRNPEPLAPVTRADRDAGGWRLEGVKLGVPAAAAAAAIVVPARTGAGPRLFLVEPGAAGVRLERQETTTREVQHLVTLDGAVVPEDSVLGGADSLAWLVRRATVGLCAMMVGVTERALRMTARYASEREQFGRPLAAFQAVSQRAADAYVDVEAIRLTTLAAAWRLAGGEADGAEADEAVAIAKFWAAEGGQRVVHTAQHLHGGVGVDVSYPLHRYFLWAKQLELGLGGAAHHLLRLGAELAGAAD